MFIILKTDALLASEVFLAEMSLRSPRKLNILVIYKNIFRIEVSQNKKKMKKTSLLLAWVHVISSVLV